MKRRVSGSFTVEAAFVMAIVLWALLLSIQAAYRIRDQTVGAMALQEAVQRLRHNESEMPEEAVAWAEKRAGTPFSWKRYGFELKTTGNPLTGNRVNASAAGGRWKLSLEQKVFDPENFLRMMTLTDQEE
ncbi:TadE/TadG family type IV pilus assembly protein [Lacrimispora sp.]|uniref:TadE/TadG family type IV pilus assembly protein n=1 Tax=Lacrimispora sp. TaxID=2719234 RepID=UPI0039934052